jgi:hypothetical protein
MKNKRDTAFDSYFDNEGWSEEHREVFRTVCNAAIDAIFDVTEGEAYIYHTEAEELRS